MSAGGSRKIFAAPVLLALLTLAGLLAGLLGDGGWLWLCWFGVGAPLTVIAYFTWGRGS